MKMKKKDKQLIGAAGEHLVLSRLLARGLLASQAPRGVRKADILVNPLDGGKPLLIQVKTRSGVGAKKRWAMDAKHEEIDDPNLFYCFVDLGEDNPSVYVVPSKMVAKIIKTGHALWLKTPGKKGQKHNDNSMRAISNEPRLSNKYAPSGWMDKYLEKWEQLK
jgi:hypothetical protein